MSSCLWRNWVLGFKIDELVTNSTTYDNVYTVYLNLVAKRQWAYLIIGWRSYLLQRHPWFNDWFKSKVQGRGVSVLPSFEILLPLYNADHVLNIDISDKVLATRKSKRNFRSSKVMILRYTHICNIFYNTTWTLQGYFESECYKNLQITKFLCF